MNNLTDGIEDSFAEFAANNDVKNFKLLIQTDPSGIDQVCLWYGRRVGTKQMILLQRTPLMVACTYGSIDIVKFILSLSISDVNRICGHSTALHCAASGGSSKAVEIVKLLLEAGADHDLIDINGYRPIDVILVSPNLFYLKSSLQELLSTDYRRTIKKEYPIDPTIPDINDGVYSTDEFRMFSFKIRPCSRAYSHDWTECPFVHPGENGRRRDPRKYHYSCVPCPDFRKGSCRRGDVCKYAHGVFECWLHPAQYRTRPCKDGMSCNRRVCFFAHSKDELRPLYVSPPISPSGNGMISNVVWPHVSNLQSSRLGMSLSFNARDRLAEELSLMNELSARSNTLSPMNLEEVFSEYHQPTMLSPITTVFSPKGMVHSGFQMSPRNVDPISPMNSRVSMLSQRDHFRSFRSRELGSSSGSIVGSPSDSWSQWGSMNGEADWGVRSEEFGKFRRSSSFEIGNNGDEPDLSWVQSLVKESPQEMNETQSTNGAMEDSNLNNNPHLDPIDQTGLGAWLEQVQLDQLIAR